MAEIRKMLREWAYGVESWMNVVEEFIEAEDERERNVRQLVVGFPARDEDVDVTTFSVEQLRYLTREVRRLREATDKNASAQCIIEAYDRGYADGFGWSKR